MKLAVDIVTYALSITGKAQDFHLRDVMENGIAKMVGEAIAQEREACAKIADDEDPGNNTAQSVDGQYYDDGARSASESIADKIRARNTSRSQRGEKTEGSE